MASRVVNRMALALPVLSIDRFERDNSTLNDSSFRDIFRLAIITSRLTIMAISIQSVRSQIEFQLHV